MAGSKKLKDLRFLWRSFWRGDLMAPTALKGNAGPSGNALCGRSSDLGTQWAVWCGVLRWRKKTGDSHHGVTRLESREYEKTNSGCLRKEGGEGW